MKKNLWTRLVAAVLTTAMAFSILAVPASAATGEDIKETYVGTMAYQDDELGAHVWMVIGLSTAKNGIIELKDDVENATGEDLEDWKASVDVELILNTTKEEIEAFDAAEVVEFGAKLGLPMVEVPDGAVTGLSATRDSKIYWYTQEQTDEINNAYDAAWEAGGDATIKWENGIVTVNGKSFLPMNPDSEGTDGDVGAILAVVGVTAAAATGVYFYTHPEKWQEIKDYFADLSANVQAKVQEFTDGVKGALGIPTEEAETAETVENAENAAAPQDAAA